MGGFIGFGDCEIDSHRQRGVPLYYCQYYFRNRAIEHTLSSD
jgi:hypothetical protein